MKNIMDSNRNGSKQSRHWGLFRKKTIYREDGSPYLIRYYLFRCPWFQIVLHHILLSDNDCLHDHPWKFVSIILKGCYWEKTFACKPQLVGGGIFFTGGYRLTKHYAGEILVRPANWKHALILEKPCWTLVIMGKYVRQWGFWTKAGWKHWTEYKSTQSCDL